MLSPRLPPSSSHLACEIHRIFSGCYVVLSYFMAVLTWKELEEDLEKAEDEVELHQNVQGGGGFEPGSYDWQATALAIRLRELDDLYMQIKKVSSEVVACSTGRLSRAGDRAFLCLVPQQ